MAEGQAEATQAEEAKALQLISQPGGDDPTSAQFPTVTSSVNPLLPLLS